MRKGKKKDFHLTCTKQILHLLFIYLFYLFIFIYLVTHKILYNMNKSC